MNTQNVFQKLGKRAYIFAMAGLWIVLVMSTAIWNYLIAIVLGLIGFVIAIFLLTIFDKQSNEVQKALSTAQNQYDELFDWILMGAYFSDASGNFIQVNITFLKLFGYTQKRDAQGINLFSLIHDEHERERIETKIRENPTGAAFETYMRRQDGRRIYIQGHIYATYDDDKNIVGYRGCLNDITEHHQSLQELKRIKDFNEYIVQNITEGILLQDVNGNITFVNPATEKLLLYTAQELQGKSWTMFIPLDQQELVRAADARRMEGTSDQYELDLLRKDDTRISTIASGRPIYEDGEFAGTLTVFTDISMQKDAEDALNQVNDELEMALLRANELAVSAEQANQSKSEFLANMSHEIRTPMNGIIGMTELALGTQLTREQQEYLTAVQSSAEALLALLNDILDFSKMESGKLELEEIDFDLRKVVEQLADILAQRANEKNLELLLYVHPDVETSLKGDPLRIRQIMVNLLGNAIKFTDVGEVALEIEKINQTESTIELLCTISDTGIGIPEDKLDLIFESFSQADGSTTRQYGGTGLGLAISKQLVESMQGEIWVESVMGQGSQFKFTMILKLGDEPAHPVVKASIEGLRVLAVDDNATNRRILHDTLRDFGCKPDIAENAASGLTKLEQATTEGHPFDLVLSDVQMPNMTGLEMLAQIREHETMRDLPVVMLTSVDELHTVTRQKDLNWSAYLTKPVKQVDLLNAMMIAIGEMSPTDIQDDSEATVDAIIKDVPLRILLVDDVEINRRLATVMLEREGFKVTCAENGKIALSVLETSDEPFDVVLMDVQMPEMDGLEATTRIRENPKLAHLPVIAMTAHAMKGDKERFLDAGMDDYVTKPIKSKTVTTAIARQYHRVVEAHLVEAKEPVLETIECDEILDPSGPMEWLGDDKEAFAELIRLFLDEVRPLIDELGEAILNRDTDTVDKLGHSIKGASANMGALQLQFTASKLEQMGKAQDLTEAPPQFAELKQAMERFEAHCQKYL